MNMGRTGVARSGKKRKRGSDLGGGVDITGTIHVQTGSLTAGDDYAVVNKRNTKTHRRGHHHPGAADVCADGGRVTRDVPATESVPPPPPPPQEQGPGHGPEGAGNRRAHATAGEGVRRRARGPTTSPTVATDMALPG